LKAAEHKLHRQEPGAGMRVGASPSWNGDMQVGEGNNKRSVALALLWGQCGPLMKKSLLPFPALPWPSP
jgi:hypothetical protein